MRIQIEHTLQNLKGLLLGDVGRAGDLVWFSFIEPQFAKNINVSSEKLKEFLLNVQCSWRISRESKIIIGSRDIYLPNNQWDESNEEFDWDVPDANLFDERLNYFKKSDFEIFVKGVEADNLGGVKIFFSKQYLLELFPDDSSEEEYWRIFMPNSKRTHFVVTGQGIEI